MTRRYIHSLPAPDLDMEITEMENCILQINTIEGIKKHLSHYFLVVSSHMREQLEDPSALVVKQVCDIIHERYADNLTVQDIADQVYLTVPYSCTIFKREMGLTINEYLVRTRIENSKTLLSNPRYKLYEVSNAVGYQDPAYFAKQFKKHTGYTPREFRSMNIGNRTESGEYV